ncbi:hypothetical protein BD626DRAFT_514875 [Schizophyllum amplum]|uniref:Uncharacterized protein n=1 Tax=Schizophyllum amplum TaxID=97359 RepID=A0A550BY53_9AGAR|nr:hypothetical protein BD626DRAFT_514875 [Auriculariopsis ampla]
MRATGRGRCARAEARRAPRLPRLPHPGGGLGDGPPYFVRPEHYEELLGKGSELLGKGSGEMEEKIGEKEKHGEQESWEEENELSMRSWEKESWEKVYDEIPKSSLEGPRKGKERMVVWRRV